MSLSTSTEPPSSENEQNLEEKKVPSPTLTFARPNEIMLPKQSLQTTEKPKNYQKKNGLLKFKIKSENESVPYLGPQQMGYVSFSPESQKKLNHPLNFQNLFGESNYLKANPLEFETLNYKVAPPFWPKLPPVYCLNPYYGKYFPERSLIPDEFFVSKIFNKNLKNFNNFCLSQSYPNLFNVPKEIIIQKETKPKMPKEKENKKIQPQEKIKPDELIKLSFEIPDDFLLKYQIEEIEVKTIQLSHYFNLDPKSKKISFKDMELYINKLCGNILGKDVFQGKKDFGEEFIEVEMPKKEENLFSFLQKKRKLSNDRSLNGNKTKNGNAYSDASHRRHPLKKKYKKINKKLTVKLKNLIKLNNKKNGEYISVNLNQIHINKTNLEMFPFHTLINSKEITKISFLKGLAERKDLIRVNKKVGLVKDPKGQKYLLDKEFKLVYHNKEEDIEYIAHISGINILNLILYYYYQIHKGIDQINTYHYSHSAFYKSQNEINKIEEIIKKCNYIVKEIFKGN